VAPPSGAERNYGRPVIILIVSTLALLGNTDVANFTQEEWEIMTHAVDVLAVFNEVTREIFAENNALLSKTTVLSRIIQRKVTMHEENHPRAQENIMRLRKLLLEGLRSRFGQRESN